MIDYDQDGIQIKIDSIREIFTIRINHNKLTPGASETFLSMPFNKDDTVDTGIRILDDISHEISPIKVKLPFPPHCVVCGNELNATQEDFCSGNCRLRG